MQMDIDCKSRYDVICLDIRMRTNIHVNMRLRARNLLMYACVCMSAYMCVGVCA